MDFGSLTYVDKDGTQRRYPLPLGSMTLGSVGENDLVLDDPAVARFHLRLLATAAGCWAIDLGSPSGTFLNQVRMPPNVRQSLRSGDLLVVGPFAIQYNRQPAIVPPEVAAEQAIVPLIPSMNGHAGPPRLRRRLPPDYKTSSYLQYLPPIYQDDPFAGRFLLIFESILDPLERVIDQIHHYFDPLLAPEPLLPWLASWVDLVLNEKWSLERRRALVRHAAELYRWRGTRRGISEYIRIYTGFVPVIDEPDRVRSGEPALPPHVFRVILDVPDPEMINRELLETIIEVEKPAHTSYILEIRREQAATS
jgi:phage tail-like protein